MLRDPPATPSGPSPLDHVGVAVRDVVEAASAYRAVLGLELRDVEDVLGEGVRVGFLPLAGGPAIELLEPLEGDSPVARFLARRGPGVHHLSFRVRSCEAAIRSAEAAGIRVLPPAPRPGAHGTRVAFFHPNDTGGVLIEVCERTAAAPRS
ncbi:MAG: methylmalonyl-CoA epimerase [Gemmatimonadota bacterium]